MSSLRVHASDLESGFAMIAVGMHTPDPVRRAVARTQGCQRTALGGDVFFQFLYQTGQPAAAPQRSRCRDAAACKAHKTLIQAYATPTHGRRNLFSVAFVTMAEGKQSEAAYFSCGCAIASSHLYQGRNGSQVSGRVLYVSILCRRQCQRDCGSNLRKYYAIQLDWWSGNTAGCLALAV